MAEVKKTAKYYRETLKKYGASSISVSLLPEIIKKFGRKRWDNYSKTNDIINLRNYTEFYWNHRIVGFFLGNDKKVYVEVYWQGDSTDGDTSVLAMSCISGYTIRGEYEFINGRTYEKHSDLRISGQEFNEAINALVQYLSPEAIKVRKEEDRKNELHKKIYDFIDGSFKKRDDYFWNGRIGVQKLLEKEPELMNKSFEELQPIIIYVYNNNAKSDYFLRGGWFNGKKKYNLAYPNE